jgi:hypothetical protein
MKSKITLASALLTLVVILTASFINVEREKGYIYWDQRSLTWDDFKGAAPSSSPYVALTHSAIVLNFSGQDNTLNFSIESAFYPKKSWKKKNVNEYILKHEQGHFDITEIYARILRKELQEMKFKKYETLGNEVQQVFNKNSKACDDMQDQYDNETDHSKKKEEQYLWDAKIAGMLDSLAGWKTPEFVMDVGYLLE